MGISKSRCSDLRGTVNAIIDYLDEIGGGTTIIVDEEGVLVSAAVTEINFVGATVTATLAGAGVVDVTVTNPAGAQNLFERVSVVNSSGGTAVGGPCVAETTTDTLILDAGAYIGFFADASTDTITVSVQGLYVFKTIALAAGAGSVAGDLSIVADSVVDTLNLVAGAGISLTGVAGSDQITISATGSGGSSIVYAEATTDITASTGWGSFGTGTAQKKDSAGADDGSPVTVTNRFDLAFPTGSILVLDTSYTPASIVNGYPPADAAEEQYLKNSVGTLEWRTVVHCT